MRSFTKKRLFERNVSSALLGTLTKEVGAVVADGLLYTIPAGYTIEYFVFNETAGGTVTIQVGTSAGGNNIIWNQALTASKPTTITVDYTHSLSTNQAIYISDTGAGWGTASVDVYIVLQKVN
jgi:hypothetical protein